MKVRKLLISGIVSLSFLGIASAEPGAQTNVETQTQTFTRNGTVQNTQININTQAQAPSENTSVQIQIQTQTDLPSDIKAIVEQVKGAPPEERYKYMNQLKMKLRELSQEQRREVMKEVMEELHEFKGERGEHTASTVVEHDVEHPEKVGGQYERMEHEMEMENSHQERLMEREHELEERKSEIQERTNFRYIEREERQAEHEYERGNHRDFER